MKEERAEKNQEEIREKLLRNLRRFDHWLGERKEGEWIRESVATNTIRKVRRFTKSKTEFDSNGNPKIVDSEEQELIHMHHGYRPKMEDEKKTRRAFFFRGARIWRD